MSLCRSDAAASLVTLTTGIRPLMRPDPNSAFRCWRLPAHLDGRQCCKRRAICTPGRRRRRAQE
eukprot:8287519-Alexandrium_andersonii.AAC.1